MISVLTMPAEDQHETRTLVLAVVPGFPIRSAGGQLVPDGDRMAMLRATPRRSRPCRRLATSSLVAQFGAPWGRENPRVPRNQGFKHRHGSCFVGLRLSIMFDEDRSLRTAAPTRFFVRWPYVGVLAAIIGCGGATSNGGGGAGGSSGGPGGTPNDGVGGGECGCPPVVCAPGFRSVTVPGACCPICQPCGAVNCPNTPACAPGEQPVTSAGQCCPTSCGQTGAGGTGGGGAGGTGTGGGTAAGGLGGSGGYPACCYADADCGSDPAVHCVDTICLLPVPGGCWRNADCANGQTCNGARVCPCNADCSYNAVPGKCVSLPPGCCQKDSDCGDLVYEPCVNGVCKSTVPGGCWTNAECRSGGSCIGAFVCGCAARCSQGDAPGTCGWVGDAG